MPDLIRVCPYYRKPCAEARDELHLQGKECDFITRMIVEVPSPVHGARPSTKTTEVCIVRSLQQSLNALHQANDHMMVMLQQMTRAPMPFYKG